MRAMLLLVLLSVAAAFAYSTNSLTCPERLTLGKYTNSSTITCGSFCAKAFEGVVESQADREIQAFGYPPSNLTSGVCGCLILEKQDGLVVSSRYCEYSIVQYGEGPEPLKKFREYYDSLGTQNSGQDSLIGSLIRLAIFDKNASFVSFDNLEILQKGLYATYINALSTVSFTLATYLLMILAGWWLVSQGYGEWVRVLRSIRGGESFSISASSEAFKKFSLILLGIATLSFPVKINSQIFGPTGVGIGNFYDRDFYSPCSKFTEYLRSYEELTIGSIFEDLNSTSFSIDRFIIGIDLGNNWGSFLGGLWENALSNLETECNNFMNSVIPNNIQISVIPDNIQIIFRIHESPREVSVPFAIAVVNGFIKFGLKQAEVLADYVNNWIKRYYIKRFTDEYLSVKNQYLAQKAELERLINEFEKLRTGALTDGDCNKILSNAASGGGSSQISSNTNSSSGSDLSCDNLLKALDTKLLEGLSEKPECKYAVDAGISICKEINEARKRLEESEEALSKTELLQKEVIESINNSMNKIKEIAGFATPAITPMVGAYAIFNNMQDIDYARYEATLIKAERNGAGDPYSAIAGESKNESKENEKTEHRSYDVSSEKAKAFWMGQAYVLTSVPPFSFASNFFSSNVNVDSKSSFLDKIAITIQSMPVYVGTAGQAISALDIIKNAEVNSKEKAVKFTLVVLFLKIAPFLVVAFGVLFRVIAYIVELIVFILSIPFYGVLVATRREGAALNFFKKTVKFTVFPMIIAFVPLIAFLVIELYYFFFFYLPLSILSNFVPDSYAGYFFAGAIVAILYVFATLISMFSGWSIAYNLPDDFYNLFSEAVGGLETKLAGRMEGVRGVIGRHTGATL